MNDYYSVYNVIISIISILPLIVIYSDSAVCSDFNILVDDCPFYHGTLPDSYVGNALGNILFTLFSGFVVIRTKTIDTIQ